MSPEKKTNLDKILILWHYKKLGEVIVERDWVVGKLQNLNFRLRREIVDNKGSVQAYIKVPSLNRILELLGMSKTAYYYKHIVPFSSQMDKKLLDAI